MRTTDGNLLMAVSSADINRNLNPSNAVPTAGVDYHALNSHHQALFCGPREQRRHAAQFCTIVTTAQATA